MNGATDDKEEQIPDTPAGAIVWFRKNDKTLFYILIVIGLLAGSLFLYKSYFTPTHEQKVVTIVGRLIINDIYVSQEKISRISIREFSTPESRAVNEGVFKISDVLLSADRMITIVVDFKDGHKGSSKIVNLKDKQPDNSNTIDIGTQEITFNQADKKEQKQVTILGRLKVNNNDVLQENLSRISISEVSTAETSIINGGTFSISALIVPENYIITIVVDLKDGRVGTKIVNLKSKPIDNLNRIEIGTQEITVNQPGVLMPKASKITPTKTNIASTLKTKKFGIYLKKNLKECDAITFLMLEVIEPNETDNIEGEIVDPNYLVGKRAAQDLKTGTKLTSLVIRESCSN